MEIRPEMSKNISLTIFKKKINLKFFMEISLQITPGIPVEITSVYT